MRHRPVTIRQPSNSNNVLHPWKHVGQSTLNDIADLLKVQIIRLSVIFHITQIHDKLNFAN